MAGMAAQKGSVIRAAQEFKQMSPKKSSLSRLSSKQAIGLLSKESEYLAGQKFRVAKN